MAVYKKTEAAIANYGFADQIKVEEITDGATVRWSRWPA